MEEKNRAISWTLLHHLTVSGSFPSVVKTPCSPLYGEPSRCFDAGLYSRPTTKTASLPSVVLIKKTAHVKIKQQQQAVCIFRGACTREWGQKSAFPERKNPPTAFTELLHLFPGWLCSPDCLFWNCMISVHEVHGCTLPRSQVWRRNGDSGVVLWHCRRIGEEVPLKGRPSLPSFRHAFIRPFYVVLNKFALWHGATSKQSTSAAAAPSEGRNVGL